MLDGFPYGRSLHQQALLWAMAGISTASAITSNSYQTRATACHSQLGVSWTRLQAIMIIIMP